MENPRILLADDQSEMLEKVAELLHDEFDVVGAVENGERAMEFTARHDPDLLILDISMPVLNGIHTASRLKAAGSRAKVIFLTVHRDRDFVNAAFSAGALGYVLKPRLATDLVPAVRLVLQGRVFISPTLDGERDGSNYGLDSVAE
jgi:DNA-binding NarL/FixJ family response regulator